MLNLHVGHSIDTYLSISPQSPRYIGDASGTVHPLCPVLYPRWLCHIPDR